MEFVWTRRRTYPKKHYCVLPVTLKLGNEKHEWTHTRMRRTIWMENLWWTPNDMSNAWSCEGQIETDSGKFYECDGTRWRKIKDRTASCVFAWIFIGGPAIVAALVIYFKVPSAGG